MTKPKHRDQTLRQKLKNHEYAVSFVEALEEDLQHMCKRVADQGKRIDAMRLALFTIFDRACGAMPEEIENTALDALDLQRKGGEQK